MKNIQNLLDNYVQNTLYPGIQWKIQNKQNIFQGKSGYLNIANKKPIVDNTIYRIWSMTKPIVSIVVLQLIEEKN